MAGDGPCRSRARVHAGRRHGREGDRPAGSGRASRLGRGFRELCRARSRSTSEGAPETAGSSPAGTRSTGERAPSRPYETESAPPRRSTGSSDAGADRDSLACPRPARGAKTASQLLALALLGRAGASRPSRSTGPGAAGRRFVPTRESPTGRSGATTRSSTRISSSSSSLLSSARRASTRAFPTRAWSSSTRRKFQPGLQEACPMRPGLATRR